MNTATSYDIKIKTRIKLVHIAKNELRLDEQNYRAILAQWNRQGTRQPVTSSLQMTHGQLGELLEFFKGLGFKLRTAGQGSGVKGHGSSSPAVPSAPSAVNKNSWKKYDSSLDGLKKEICDLAKERWGHGSGVMGQESWEISLNNVCIRFGVKRWQRLDVAHGKEIKAFFLRLTHDPCPLTPDPSSDNEVPF
jgi:hypothetical protein